MLNLIDEHTRECLAIHVRRRINSAHLIDVLADAMIEHGIPEYIRSDNVLTREGLVGKKKRSLSIPHRSGHTLHRARVSLGERLL